MSGLQVTTPPVQEPVSLQEAKEYLRVDDSTDERIVRPFIETARRVAEEHLGRTLMTTTYSLFVDGYDELADPLWEGTRTGPYLNYYKNYINLPKCPIQSVTSVSTFDDSDNETTMAASRYYVDNVREPSRIVLRQGETFPTALRVANAIKVVYVAGYSNAYAVPEPVRMGMLQHIAFLYEHRGDMYEAASPMPPMIKNMYAPYVVHRGMGSSAFLAVG
jgi:hypothetical protein|tara:strand:+ start:375 stop:1031 length:657 start_codon:yes stop_codon:yes gene_type:complete